MAKTDGTAQWVVHNLANPYIKADTGYLPLTGGTISGNLTVTGTLNAKINHLIGYSQGSRLASANRPTGTNGAGALYSFVATSSMTEGKPPVDGHILHFNWDNTAGFDSQFAVQNTGSRAWIRGQNAGTWGDWRALVTAPKSTAVGSASTPVYVDAMGQVTACTNVGTTSNITVTGSTQSGVTAEGTTIGGITGTEGSGDSIARYEYRTVAGVGAGTYTLQQLLQKLVNNNHSHSMYKILNNCNCNCNCDCTDSDSDCDSDSDNTATFNLY